MTYNDKAYTSPQPCGQFCNFRIFIKSFTDQRPYVIKLVYDRAT